MNPEEADYKKALLFKIGVIIIVVAVFSLWLANLQNVFESKSSTDNDALKSITDNINKSLKEAEDNFNRSASSTEKAFVDGLLDSASSTATSTMSTSTAAIEIKKELTDLMKDVATSTATTTKKTGCPEYINCMPTIGEARPCVIPAGCEDITQIAY